MILHLISYFHKFTALFWSLFVLTYRKSKNIFKTSSPRVPTNPFVRKRSHILHNICETLVGTRGGGGYPTAQNVMSGRARTFTFGFWCALSKIFFFQYKEIISTSKLPFHNPLVMKYYNVLAYFSLYYENFPFTKFSW